VGSMGRKRPCGLLNQPTGYHEMDCGFRSKGAVFGKKKRNKPIQKIWLNENRFSTKGNIETSGQTKKVRGGEREWIWHEKKVGEGGWRKKERKIAKKTKKRGRSVGCARCYDYTEKKAEGKKTNRNGTPGMPNGPVGGEGKNRSKGRTEPPLWCDQGKGKKRTWGVRHPE